MAKNRLQMAVFGVSGGSAVVSSLFRVGNSILRIYKINLDRHHQNCVYYCLKMSTFRRKMAVFGVSGGFLVLGVDKLYIHTNKISTVMNLQSFIHLSVH